ncbi:MAG: ankyrin repeat domain-containing protein [Candidatus Caldatribacteriaceae bacterium]
MVERKPRDNPGSYRSRAEVNACDEYSSTPLILAARWNRNPEILEVLLEAGADATVSDAGERGLWTMLGKTLPLGGAVFWRNWKT